MKVLIVDDHEVVRVGLASVLAHADDLLVVGTLARAEDAIQQLDELSPDVVVLDYRLPSMNGAVACEKILQQRPGTWVIILTSAVDDAALISCLAAGAKGFLLKTSDTPDIIESIRAVARGVSVVAPEALDSVLHWIRQSANIGRDGDQLCPQEVLALSLVAQGRKNREIARHLHLTEGAVKTVLNGAKKKLGTRDRSEAVLAAIRRGMI